MKIRAFFIVTIILGIALAGTAFSGGEANYKAETEKLYIISENNKKHLFNVEVSRTPAELKFGLMYRNEMALDHGMLFVFPLEQMRSFWMKNTFIPLDMIFIRKNGTIVNIEANAKPLDLSSRPSKAPALAVLEINGGLSEKLGIKAGDVIYHNAFGNMDLIKDIE
jgi:uncharacterized membrane protein (UPF0127 family)